jgi:LAO/AO transport system kinase
LAARLYPHTGRAQVVGVTGAPGSGKSTLARALALVARARGRTVGVLAVDPSSPFTGGAILGDRIRMTATLDDDAVFMRSLASRGHLGGLSPAAVRVIDALDAAGKDIILIETVGTGQSEIDVAEVTDVRVLVTAPGLGDDIQAMKAGLIEIADVMVVNKADREGADRTAQELKSALSLRARDRAQVPVLKTWATAGQGLEALGAAIEEAGARATAAPPQQRRRRRARYLIARAAADLIAERIRQDASGEFNTLVDAVLSGALLPADAARKLSAWRE